MPPVLLNPSRFQGVSGYAAAVLADSPWAFWPCDDASGSSQLADASGNARPFTVNGTPNAWRQSGAGSSVLGIEWPAATTAWATGTVNPTANPSAVTLEAWVFLTATPASQFVVAAIDTSSAGIYLSVESGGQARFTVVNTGGSFVSSTVLALNTWHHLVGVSTGGVHHLRYDKTNSGTNSKALPTMSGKAPQIHRRGTGVTSSGGIVGPVSYYETALSDAQIDAHYNAA
jgi:concanavalin A-like lectin/glucanase superfamily protein